MPSGYGAMKAKNMQEKNLTADYTIDPLKDIGVCFTNTGASGAVEITLPDATVGQVYRVRTDAAQTVELDPQDSDDITNISGVDSTNGKHIISNGDGNEYLEIVCYAAGHWTVTEQLGTWAMQQ